MIYADTSFFIALRIIRDTFNREASAFYARHQEETWLWSPWHRIEVLNSIRQLVRHPDKARRLALSEARALIHRLETDVRQGYLSHLESDWRDVMATANDISIGLAFDAPCRAADLLHVAYAKELSAETFVTFDDLQREMAKAAGMKTVRPNLR